MSLLRLEPQVQHYAWGDPRFIPELLGRENPEEIPYAELWMGAHPDLPSRVGTVTLREVIARDPDAVLGSEVAKRFGGELPYLIKLLSAAVPLSVQAHPNEEQARAGYERENAAGVPLDSAKRSYKDRRGKAELIAALTDFYALVGFRPLAEIAAVLDEVPELHRLGPGFAKTEAGLRALYETVASLEQAEVDGILDPILARLRRRSFERYRREFWMVRCDDVFARGGRHDRGLFSVLLMNLVRLRPGQALYLAPGLLHAYLEGAGIEIMSASNNVLRGGLTEKHVDTAELTRTVVFSGAKPKILEAVPGPAAEWVYPTPSKEFELRRLGVSTERPHRSSPPYSAEILLATEAEGELEVLSSRERVNLARGQSLLVTRGTAYEIRGRGAVFIAAVPDPAPRFRGRRPAELRFGTSGLRGPVAHMTDLEVYVNTRGFLEYLLGRREVYRGDPVSLAGDLRPSTERILRSVHRAATDAGFRTQYLGRIPTPALTLDGILKGRSSIMVTGSHIPFDRNGIKFNRPAGEVLKSHEAGILEAVGRVRALEYGRADADSPFGDDGMLREERSRAVPDVVEGAREAYARRYLDFFPEACLAGKRVVFFQHSAVGRDLLVEILTGLGAEVLPMGRAEKFVPIDTEDVSEGRLRELQELAAVAHQTLGAVDAIVSTDGDSDRPLVVGLAADGSARFFGGDLLGVLVADYLEADAVVVPVSSNDAVDLFFAERNVRVSKTRIGSPYVIQGMEELRTQGKYRRIVGFEANGGFLTASRIDRGGRTLRALPTRDAALPILAALHATVERGGSLPELFSRLPRRFGKSGLLDEFPVEASRAILGRFSSEAGRRELGSYFSPELGFGTMVDVDDTDGLRIRFDNGDVAHVRPSGNAPQLRIYAVAGSQERADEIVRLALGEPDGVLRRLERAVGG